MVFGVSFGDVWDVMLIGWVVIQIMGQVSRTFDVGAKANGDSGEKDSKISRLQLTDQEKKKLAALVSQAGSREEVVKLEKDFMEGRIPAGVIADGEDAMEE